MADKDALRKMMQGEPSLTREICERDYKNYKRHCLVYSWCGACYSLHNGVARLFKSDSVSIPANGNSVVKLLAENAFTEYTTKHGKPDVLFIHKPRGPFRTKNKAEEYDPAEKIKQ